MPMTLEVYVDSLVSSGNWKTDCTFACNLRL